MDLPWPQSWKPGPGYFDQCSSGYESTMTFTQTNSATRLKSITFGTQMGPLVT